MNPAMPEPARWRVEHGDSLEVLAAMAPASVDAIVTDPPYGLEFMGREWDSFRRDEPASERHRGERAGAHGRLEGGGYADGTQKAKVSYGGGGKRPTTQHCVGCGKRDQFNRPHDPCGAGSWERVTLDPHAAPPSMLAFQAWCEAWTREALRVLKPGGHLLAFGGTRTYHRLTCAIEDAGFEVRDCIAWMYGSGFPKSLDVGKAIDKAAGYARGTTLDVRNGPNTNPATKGTDKYSVYANTGTAPLDSGPATPDAVRWDGWGTALKPAFEPIVVARKPLAGTVAGNVLAHGTGALNVDGCRIEGTYSPAGRYPQDVTGGRFVGAPAERASDAPQECNPSGRWPANVALSHAEGCVHVGIRAVRSNGHYPAARPGGSRTSGPAGHVGQDDLTERHTTGESVPVWDCAPGCPVRLLDEQTGTLTSNSGSAFLENADGDARAAYGAWQGNEAPGFYGDSGGASRFFYTAKTSVGERNAMDPAWLPRARSARKRYQQDAADRWRPRLRNRHPTVKPIGLMRWLVRLVTPPGGLVVDPFSGSGSTGCAAVLEGMRYIGIEREIESVIIGRARIAFWAKFPVGTSVERALAHEAERRASTDDAHERWRGLAADGQLDLLAGLGGMLSHG